MPICYDADKAKKAKKNYFIQVCHNCSLEFSTFFQEKKISKWSK